LSEKLDLNGLLSFIQDFVLTAFYEIKIDSASTSSSTFDMMA